MDSARKTGTISAIQGQLAPNAVDHKKHTSPRTGMDPVPVMGGGAQIY